MTDLFVDKGARFSDCGLYRYQLWRIWYAPKGLVCFVMLNPSTADEVENDPTVERCERRVHLWGYGGLIVVNLFAFRSTDPDALYRLRDPEGPANRIAIADAASRSSIIVLAWGTHGALNGRGPELERELIRIYGSRVMALRRNRDGSPAHPLYVPYSMKAEV